ncbi:MAG: SLC13 family permease, partial [Verrucomicrobiota bacterium]|nr:SLC13 family permease [Verrucomicrobiota bacterium]
MLAALDHGAHAEEPWITYLFTGLLGAMVLCLALEEKIHAKKSVIVGVTAVVALLLGAFTGILPFGPVDLPNGHQMNLPVFIPGIEWGVVTIILGSSLFVDVTSKSGLFTFIAIKLTKVSKGDPRRLLWFYGVMTVVFSAVLNNVTAMIIVGSLSAVSLGKRGQRDKLRGFLLVEGLLTNIGGLLTLISSVPNIIVGTTAEIGFITFFLKAAPYVIVATAATIVMGARVFGIESLKTDEERAVALADGHSSLDAARARRFKQQGPRQRVRLDEHAHPAEALFKEERRRVDQAVVRARLHEDTRAEQRQALEREEKGAKQHAVLATRPWVARQRRDHIGRVLIVHLIGEHGHPHGPVRDAAGGVRALVRVQPEDELLGDLARVDRAAHVQQRAGVPL